MSVNNYIDIAHKVTGAKSSEAANMDRSEQVNVGLDYARRQAEKQPPQDEKIPSLGAVPFAN